MDVVLAWALAQAAGSHARELAEALASGALRVTFEGRTVEYRNQADMEATLRNLFGAANPAQRRGPRISRGAGL